jgi:MFS family permease
MELKQKKTIYWSVVLTLLISTFLLILYNDYEDIFKEGIWNGLGMLFVGSLIILSLPSVLFYRVLIGKIPINPNNMGMDYYIGFILIVVMISFFMLSPWIGNFFNNPPHWLLPMLVVIILSYVVHKLLKRFVFEFKKEESENDEK